MLFVHINSFISHQIDSRHQYQGGSVVNPAGLTSRRDAFTRRDDVMGSIEAVLAAPKSLKRRATVIYRRDDEILFVRKRHAKWNLPGGRVEQGETPLQAALREMVEETGLAFEQLNYVSEYAQDDAVHFLFEARLTLAQEPRPCNEIDDCRWISAKELSKRNVRAPIRLLLERSAADVQGDVTAQ